MERPRSKQQIPNRLQKNKMNVRIRRLRFADAENLQKCINHREVIDQLTDIEYPFTFEKAKEYIAKSIKDKDSYEFVIIFHDEIVGTVVLENPNKKKDSFEIGYFVAKPYWGKGIATEAVKKICDFGFNKLKIMKIWAGIWSTNPASGRVLEKSGFELIEEKENLSKKELIYALTSKFND